MVRALSTAKRQVAGLVLVLAAATTSCTTFVQPTTCEHGSTACGGIHDARFCERVAIDVEGADCDVLGLLKSKPFCVVQADSCVKTPYAVKGRDCKVLRYEAVRDSMRAECPSGAAMFVHR